jgi:hypothetical protein
LNELIKSLLLIDWHGVDLHFQSLRRIGFEIDCMVLRLVLQKSMGFSFQEDFCMTLILLGYKFFEHFLEFAFTSFHGEFGRQSVSGTDPDFIGGICDNSGFDSSSAFQVIGFEDIERGWSKLFWAVQNLHLTRVPVYGRVNLL